MEFDIPFLNPAWLGVALAASLAASALLPERARPLWAVVGAGLLVACLLALAGAIPWVGTLHASAYAACMVAAFVVGYLATLPRARLIGLPEQTQLTIFMFALVGGIIGARFGEVWEQWPRFAQTAAGARLGTGALLLKIADIDSGGMVWYGGVMLATTLIIIYLRRQRRQLLPLADLILPSTVLALGIGRVGCFLNGCCYGKPTDLPWAVIGASGAHIHPTQLYETGACLIIAGAAIWWWYRRTSQGQVTVIVLFGYTAWRTFNEALRGDTVMTTFWGLFPATTSQALSLDFALATVVAIGVVQWRRRHSPELGRLAREVPGSRAAQHPAVPAPGA
jgi:phosphatidylglycerol:prolipoprotein diacylglycerol transferase